MLHPILNEIHEQCKYRDNFDYHCGFLDALRYLDTRIKAGEIIIGQLPQGDFDEEEAERDVREAIERMREEDGTP